MQTLQTTPAGYPIFTVDTAPEGSKPVVAAIQKMFGGVVPNLFAVSAISPQLIAAQATLNQLVDETSLTNLEVQVIDLAVSRENDCAYCTAAHTFLSRRLNQDAIAAANAGTSIADPKIEAIRQFAIELVQTRGHVSDKGRAAFLAAGNTKEQAMEVILVVALKQMQNHVNEIAKTPIDSFFA
ncbi:MAG: carboxymuconolactone decarboxylase family protein [Fimbriimonas sp.]